MRLQPTQPNWRSFTGADSGGGRDELVESFGGSIPSEGLARAAVEEVGDLVEVVLAVDGEVGAFGQELADQAVPVLVGSSLPGGVRVAEVDRAAGGDAEGVVGGEFPALVPGQGSGQLGGEPGDVLGEAGSDVFGGFGLDLDQHPEPGCSFHEGGHGAAVVGADQQVAFPVARNRSVLGLGGPLGDVDHVPDLGSRPGCSTVWSAPGPPRPQAGGQFFAQLTLGLDV